MSRSTFEVKNTGPTQRKETSCSMCSENLTMHPQFWKTFPNPSTNDSPKFSSDKECFDSTKHVHIYQEALDKSSYRYDLSYKVTPSQTRRRARQGNIIWYNLPYSRNVETKVGKCFLSLIDQHFPKSNPLHLNEATVAWITLNRLYQATTKLYLANLQIPIKIVTAENQKHAPWMKTAA